MVSDGCDDDNGDKESGCCCCCCVSCKGDADDLITDEDGVL